jgi:hypothetical protein
METLCEGCAESEAGDMYKYGLTLSEALRSLVVDPETGERLGTQRKLVFSYCPTCSRKVVIDETKRERERRRQHIFCSEVCYQKHRNLMRRHEPHELECQVCGESFTAKRSDARYCSARCRMRAHRQRGAT